MVIETELVPFLPWLVGTDGFASGALAAWLSVVAVVLVLGLLAAFLASAARHGPAAAVKILLHGLWAVVDDLRGISPRRVLALSRLAVLESLRRLVLVAFAVFVVVLLFASWYLDKGAVDPAKLYLSSVLTATSFLVLALALFLSVFSLPADLAQKTIHTVVTKPARISEIVLGRILGFVCIGTAMLALTGALSWGFVVRGLIHTHEVVEGSLESVPPPKRVAPDPNPIVTRGNTTRDFNHRHEVYLREDGTGTTDVQQGHWHDVRAVQRDGTTDYEVGPPQGLLVARVPIYGKLQFFDRTGAPKEKGINVGNEWTYRGYIDGGSLASAVWEFEGLHPERFPDGLPLEFQLSVFRTHKGEIERGIRGSLSLIAPEGNRPIEVHLFEAREFDVNKLIIPLELRNPDPDGPPLKLFGDVIQDGRVKVQIRCLDFAQYFGMAQPDLYVRAGDAPFTLNFLKGYVGIWLQMLLVICLGVMFSTFLNAAVAMLATLAAVIFGFFTDFVLQLANREFLGGGPVESLYRIVTQRNLTAPLEEGAAKTFVEFSDTLIRPLLQAVGSVMPNFAALSDVDYVAYGFNIPGDRLAIHALTAVAYAVPFFLAGFVFLKFREIAR